MTSRAFALVIILQFFFSFYVVPVPSLSCRVPSTNVKRADLEYYWKDYTGVIPSDAIEGGTDEIGNPTYIGQAYFEKLELLPVVIFVGCKNANATAYSDEISTDKNIKILCSKHKERFEWVVTRNEEPLPNRHLVVGGYEVGQTLTLGRVQHDGKLVTGKVFSYPLGNRGLWIPYKGRPINFLSYEILTYNYEVVEPEIVFHGV